MEPFGQCRFLFYPLIIQKRLYKMERKGRGFSPKNRRKYPANTEKVVDPRLKCRVDHLSYNYKGVKFNDKGT